jgi:ATP-dependent protease Clp ATPase subunit
MLFRRLRCSFCRRSNTQVAKLVKGASGYICDTCAYEAVRIMETTRGETAAGPKTDVVTTRTIGWNRTWHFTTSRG